MNNKRLNFKFVSELYIFIAFCFWVLIFIMTASNICLYKMYNILYHILLCLSSLFAGEGVDKKIYLGSGEEINERKRRFLVFVKPGLA